MSATPIFDLEQPPPEPRRKRKWLPMLIGMIIGLAATALLILQDEGRLPHWHWPAANGLLIFPALYIAIAFHELGHLAAGRLAGFDVGGIAVGGFYIFKSGKHWTFRFDRRAWIGGFFKPLTKAGALHPSRCAWMIAGGPLASVALTLLCGIVVSQYGNGAWDWVGTLFWVSLFILFVSAWPASSGLCKSDGALLRLFVFHPEQTRSWMALATVQTEETNGLRPHEWDAQSFDEILAVETSAGAYPYCQLLAFYRRLDEESELKALDHLENALAYSASAGKAFRHALFLEAASASALVRKQAAQARIWRDRACTLRKPESLDVVEAGIAMCEGRYEEASHRWEAARTRLARRRLDSGLIRFAKEQWDEQEASCRAFQPSSSMSLDRTAS